MWYTAATRGILHACLRSTQRALRMWIKVSLFSLTLHFLLRRDTRLVKQFFFLLFLPSLVSGCTDERSAPGKVFLLEILLNQIQDCDVYWKTTSEGFNLGTAQGTTAVVLDRQQDATPPRLSRLDVSHCLTGRKCGRRVWSLACRINGSTRRTQNRPSPAASCYWRQERSHLAAVRRSVEMKVQITRSLMNSGTLSKGAPAEARPYHDSVGWHHQCMLCVSCTFCKTGHLSS